jgi:hypothetical protein
MPRQRDQTDCSSDTAFLSVEVDFSASMSGASLARKTSISLSINQVPDAHIPTVFHTKVNTMDDNKKINEKDAGKKPTEQ